MQRLDDASLAPRPPGDPRARQGADPGAPPAGQPVITVDVRHARHEEVTPTLAEASVDLIVTDPPYFRVKDLPWDRQWGSDEAFLAWMDTLAAEWARVLKPTGSLYVFASPQMAARVECLLRRRFRVLNHVVWVKSTSPTGSGKHSRAERSSLRAYFPRTERVIFCEPYARAGKGIKATADTDVRISVFAPLRDYLRAQVAGAGLDMHRVNTIIGSSTNGGGMAAHYCGTSQWELPTEKHYAALQAAAPDHFLRSYADLRFEYEVLQGVYEAARRPFHAERETFTDVWTFQSTAHRPGRHPCEKPPELADHIIEASSRPADLVFDGFAGSGAFGAAAARLGRSFIGCDADEWWASRARRAAESAAGIVHRPAVRLHAAPKPLTAQGEQLTLWGSSAP